jgi:antitoxin FitA
MPKTIQIRNIDDDVYAALRRKAAEAGLSVPDLLRKEAERLASRMTMEEWFERVRRGPRSDITRAEILEALDEIRGPWPDADR